MKREQLQEVLDFLNSIEGSGYGGMAAFEIARDNVAFELATLKVLGVDQGGIWEASEIRQALLDPNVVHLNMLRGGIAKPSWDQIRHIYPEQFKEIAS